MPITINYIDGGVGIEIVAHGVVTGKEIIRAHEEIYNNEHIHKQKYHIIDRTHCEEYNVSSEEVVKIAELDKKASLFNPNIIIALVASDTLQFGMSRMWQIYTEDSLFLTEIFHDRASADRWLKKQLSTKQSH